MDAIGNAPTRAHAEPLARLHAEALPASLLSQLGHTALVRYYAFLIGEPRVDRAERVWIVFDKTELIGACVLSDAPETLMRRFARHAPVQLARELGTQLVRSRALRRRFLKRLREREGGDGPHAPEVTQIFTDARRRGRGIGAALLETCEADLRTRGITKYFVHTERDDNEAGIRFYRREGFVPIAESRSFGTAFLVMQKDLA